MASLSGVYNLQVFTDLGALAANYRLYTYTPNTTAHKIAYTDEAGTIAHTYASDGVGGQYVQVNARGELPAPLFLNAGGYDLTLKTAAGVTVWTRRAVGGADAGDTLRTDLAAPSDITKGDALIAEKLTDTGAVETTLHERSERRVLEAFDFMTPAQIADICSATPALDHTAALQAAIDAAQVLGKGERRLRINSTLAGHFRITAPLVVTGNFLTIEWDSTSAIIKKFFNGDMFRIFGGEVEFNRCGLDGNGATYTGGGIRLITTSANSFRLINPRIKETASAPLLIEADAGSLMKIMGGLLQPYNAAAAGPTHGIAMTGADTAPANRKVIGVSMGGAPIIDATGAETVQIIGCDGSKITTSSTSKKISASGNRMQTAGANVTISGVDHCFVGNTMASSFELLAAATNCVVKENVTVGTVEVIDSSGNSSNKVTFFGSAYTPTWTAATVNPTLGNGALTGLYDRNDRHVTMSVDLTIGSTTTMGTGQYSFALPIQAVSARSFVGSAWLNDAATAFYAGVALVTPGATTCEVYFNAGASAMSPTVPIVLATGDRLRFQVAYVPT